MDRKVLLTILPLLLLAGLLRADEDKCRNWAGFARGAGARIPTMPASKEDWANWEKIVSRSVKTQQTSCTVPGAKAATVTQGSGAEAHARLVSRQSSATIPAVVWVLSNTSPTGSPVTDAGVYAVDPDTQDTVASIAIPGPIPLAIAASHSGAFVYATVQGFAGVAGTPAHPPQVAVISTSAMSVVQTINLPQGTNPGKPALSPDDRYLYIPSDGTSSGVLVVDTQNPSSITTIPVMSTNRLGAGPAMVDDAAITPDGELLFLIESGGSGFVYVVDTTAGQQIAQLSAPLEQGLPQNLADLAVDPTGSRVFVGGSAGSGALTQYTGFVTAYDTATLTQAGSVLLKQGMYVNNVGISPDGSIILANDEFSTAAFAIDSRTLAVAETDFPAPPPDTSGQGYVFDLVILP